MGSNRARDMDICPRLFCVCVVLCVRRRLAKGLIPIQGSPTDCRKIHISGLILMGNGPEGLIRKSKEEAKMEPLYSQTIINKVSIFLWMLK
jgi:hypothetical protein